MYRADTSQAFRFSSFNSWYNEEYQTDFILVNDQTIAFDQSVQLEYSGEDVDLEESKLVGHWYDQLETLEREYGDADSSLISDSLWLSIWRDDADLLSRSRYGDYIGLEYRTVRIPTIDQTDSSDLMMGAGLNGLYARTVKQLSMFYVRRQYDQREYSRSR